MVPGFRKISCVRSLEKMIDFDWIPTIFWAVEGGKLVRYARSGACNLCNKCCKGYRIIYKLEVSLTQDQSDKGGTEDWASWEGWSIFYAQGTWWYIEVTVGDDPEAFEGCDALTEEGLCSKWQDLKGFKPICRYWPFHPKDLEKFPECGFSFRRLYDPEHRALAKSSSASF